METLIRNLSFRICGLILLLAVPGLSGCLLGSTPGTVPEDPTFVQLSDPQFKAETPCQKIVEQAVSEDLGTTCKDENNMATLAAGVQGLFREVDALLRVYAAPQDMVPQGVDYGNLIEPLFRRILDRLQDIETVANDLKNRKWPDLAMYFDHVTVEVTVRGLTSNPQSVGRLKLDLAGEWNRVEVLVFGTLASLILGGDDWFFAHGLVMDDTSIIGSDSGNMTGMLAGLMARNPAFLNLKNAWRLDDAREHFRLLLDFLAGTTGEGAEGSQGLFAALEEQLARDSIPGNNLVQVLDRNGNGLFDLGDRLTIEPINEAVRQLALEKELPELGDIDNRYLNRISLIDLTALGAALGETLRDDTVAPVGIMPYLRNVIADLEKAAGVSSDVVALNWFAIQPGHYFSAHKGLRELLPAIYAVNVASDGTRYGFRDRNGNTILDENNRPAYIPERPDLVDWELMIECELSESADSWEAARSGENSSEDLWHLFCGNGYGSSRYNQLSSKQVFFSVGQDTNDPGHFVAQNLLPAYPTDVQKLNAFVWADGTNGISPIYPDGEVPAELGTLSSGLSYIGWQDPTFGNMFYVDPDGEGNFKPADNFTANQTFARIINYYADAVRKGLYTVAGNENPDP